MFDMTHNLWRSMNPDFEICLESARQYKNATEWRSHDKKNYFLAKESNYLERIYRALGWRTNRNWTLTICLRVAQEFDSPSAWCQSTGYAKSAYIAACNEKWLPEIRQKLGWDKVHTFDSCMKDAEKYPNAKAWIKSGDCLTHRIAHINGWLKEIATKRGWAIRMDWTLEKCMEFAKSFGSSSEWSRSDGINRKAYVAACRYKWLAEISQKLNWEKKHKRTYDECKEAASKFTCMIDWVKKDHPTYQFSLKRKWHRKIATELGWELKNDGKRTSNRTYEECKEQAKVFKELVEWWKAEPASYAYAYRRKWHKKIARELGWNVRGQS